MISNNCKFSFSKEINIDKALYFSKKGFQKYSQAQQSIWPVIISNWEYDKLSFEFSTEKYYAGYFSAVLNEDGSLSGNVTYVKEANLTNETISGHFTKMNNEVIVVTGVLDSKEGKGRLFAITVEE